ncbi:MAG: hypothetical protein EXR59_01050 [Dehalococcoidia bacterium]|nr:hypothetical protein [Dehalococcoidia bacterium]
MKRLILAALLLSLVLSLSMHLVDGFAQASKGTISIMAINGTSGGDQPSGATVLLQSARDDKLVEAGKATLDSSGIANFNDFDVSRLYVATITYKNVPFFSDVIQFTAGQSSVMSHVSVYESTGDPAVISDARIAMYISERDGIVQVTEAHSVTNSSTLVYVGSAPGVAGRFQTVRIGLPTGASVPTYAAGFSETTVQRGGNVLTDTRPILPGRKEYAFSYDLVYLSNDLEMSRRFFVPTSRFEVFLPSGVLNMQGPQLTKEDQIEISGRKLDRYSVSSIGTGSSITMTLGNLPYHDSLTPLRNWILILGGLSGVGLIGWRVFRRKRTLALQANQ